MNIPQHVCASPFGINRLQWEVICDFNRSSFICFLAFIQLHHLVFVLCMVCFDYYSGKRLHFMVHSVWCFDDSCTLLGTSLFRLGNFSCMILLSILSETLIECSSSIASLLMLWSYSVSWILWILSQEVLDSTFISWCVYPFYCIFNARDLSSISVFSHWTLPVVPMCTPKVLFLVFPQFVFASFFCISWSLIVCFLQHLVYNFFIYRIYWFHPLFCFSFPGCLWGIYWFPPIVFFWISVSDLAISSLRTSRNFL